LFAVCMRRSLRFRMSRRHRRSGVDRTDRGYGTLLKRSRKEEYSYRFTLNFEGQAAGDALGIPPGRGTCRIRVKSYHFACSRWKGDRWPPRSEFRKTVVCLAWSLPVPKGWILAILVHCWIRGLRRSGTENRVSALRLGLPP
jgi:hypothetical protein